MRTQFRQWPVLKARSVRRKRAYVFIAWFPNVVHSGLYPARGRHAVRVGRQAELRPTSHTLLLVPSDREVTHAAASELCPQIAVA